MIALDQKTVSVLADIGVERAPGGFPVFADISQAEHGYIHHSRMPVALTAFALISASFAKGRFPKTRLVELVAKRPSMDDTEAVALAALAGVQITGLIRGEPEAFVSHLRALIERHNLNAFFGRAPRPAMNGIDIRPAGIHPERDEIVPAEIAAWRKAYKALPAARQMMVATTICLYRGDVDETWLSRVPYAWHAVDGITALREAGMLQDWAKLVALYPGW